MVVLIDEAQGLSIENLELVRMLSNLETTRSKLLQIILVGQPELADKLDSYELRQLAQRISLNYHLCPLTVKESEAYIQHRLGIATQRKTALFTANACRSAYHYSGGIPRLINIVCDRALLLAYSHNRPRVTRKIMQAAIRELMARGQAQATPRYGPYLIGGSSVLFVVSLAIAFFIWQSRYAGNFHPPPSAPYGSRVPEKDPGQLKSYKVVPIPAPDSSSANPVDFPAEDKPNVVPDTAGASETQMSPHSLPADTPAETGRQEPAGVQAAVAEIHQPLNPSQGQCNPLQATGYRYRY